MQTTFQITQVLNESFLLHSEFKEQYEKFSNLGLTYSRTINVCICGLARDVGPRIQNNLEQIKEVKDLFKTGHIVIYENDSKDDTQEKIKEWTKNNKNTHLITEKHGATHPVGPSSKSVLRTQALAKYRNICKSYIKENIKDLDYVIVLDLDSQFINIIGILNSFGWIIEQNIDIMAGYSYLPYKKEEDGTLLTSNYDSWAFRQNWWEDRQNTMMWFLYWHPYLGSSPIKANSAFGGSCLYKAPVFFSSEYEGSDCEHVCFHKNIHQKYPDCKLFVNPSQFMITS